MKKSEEQKTQYKMTNTTGVQDSKSLVASQRFGSCEPL